MYYTNKREINSAPKIIAIRTVLVQRLSRESERGKKARLSTHAYNHDSGC